MGKLATIKYLSSDTYMLMILWVRI